MRYLIFFFFLFLHSCFAFSQDAPPANCPVSNPGGCVSTSNNAYESWCQSTGSNFVATSMPGSCPPGNSPKQCVLASSCTCPDGYRFNVIMLSGIKFGSCILIPEEPLPPEDCPAGQVYYLGICRDSVDEPPQCGNTYDTAISVGGAYVCASGGCEAGSTVTNYSTETGSWSVCGSGNDSPSSSPSTSSAPSSTPSTGGDSSSGNSTGSNSSSGDGSGTGGGSGTGDGTGSGNNPSTPSDTGSGSGDSGIGTGSAAAANCDGGEPECDGDPIQCALLIQLWINNCAGYDEVELNNPADDNEAIRDNFDALMSSAEPSVNAEGVLDSMTPGGGSGNGIGSGSGSGTGSGNGSGGGNGIDLSGLDGAAGSGAGGSCPADRQINLASGSYSISYQFFCDFASQVSGLVLLIFSYIGAMIVYRSLQW